MVTRCQRNYEATIGDGEGIWADNESAFRLSRNCNESPVNFTSIASRGNHQPYVQRMCEGFNRLRKFLRVRARLRIENKCNAPQLWGNLLDELQPLGSGRELEAGKSSNVATWVRKARDKALSHRIADKQKHDWYRTGLVPNCSQRQRAVSDNHVRLLTDQFCSIGLRSGCVSPKPSIINMDVTSLGPTELAKSLPKQSHAPVPVRIVLTGRY